LVLIQVHLDVQVKQVLLVFKAYLVLQPIQVQLGLLVLLVKQVQQGKQVQLV